MKTRSERAIILTCLLISLICAVIVIGVNFANAEVFDIQVDSVYEITEEGFYTLLTATCLDTVNTSHTTNVTFTINGAAFTYNNYTARYEATYMRNTPGVEEFGSLGVFADSENVTSSASVSQNATVTWTEGTMSRLQTDFMTGDWINAILGEYTYMAGATFFWTATMAIITIGVYNVGGAYVAVFSWIIGWGVFSGVVHGRAQVIAYIFILIATGYALVKLALDRRAS